MSSQVSRNIYLQAYRKKQAAKKASGSEKEKCMKAFAEMMEMVAPEPLTKAVLMMKKMIADEEVQRQGCFALAYKAITHGRTVIKEGGLDATLAAMNRHGQCERLQFDGLELLWRLSMDEDGAQRVLDDGGLTAVIAALSIHNESVRVQEEAAGAIRWMADRDPKRVLDGGGLEAIIRIMENFPQFSWIQMWACGAILSFSELDNLRVQDLGGYRMIKDALNKHPTSPEVQRLGTLALKLDP